MIEQSHQRQQQNAGHVCWQLLCRSQSMGGVRWLEVLGHVGEQGLSAWAFRCCLDI